MYILIAITWTEVTTRHYSIWGGGGEYVIVDNTSVDYHLMEKKSFCEMKTITNAVNSKLPY